MYPITIVDNFFTNPDKVVEFAMNQEFFSSEDSSWPGKRTHPVSVINPNLFQFVGDKIHKIFYNDAKEWFLDIRFQLIDPFSEDQYHIKNRGWIHKDEVSYFGGIIYLTKNPDKDTGTSLYCEKDGYSIQPKEFNFVKERFYGGEEVSDEEYQEAFWGINSQYEETVSVENVYNRLLMFSSADHHGVQTFGKTKQRLTMTIFSYGTPNKTPPLYR